MRKTINSEKIEGRVYAHNLTLKTVQNKESANFGKEFINGSIDVATDEDCLNVVTVYYTYEPEFRSSGTKNNTYSALKTIIDSGKTVSVDGKDAATKVKISTSLGVNDFYTNNNGTETLVSAKRNSGGFISIVSSLEKNESKRNTFECDMFITGTNYIEKDEEKNIDEDYIVVKGAVFDFRGALLPVDFVCRDPQGIKYFDGIDKPTFTKVWGNIISRNIVTKVEEESAFGTSAVKEYSRSSKEWTICGTSAQPYEIGDEETGVTVDEIKSKQADRETLLADVKKRYDDYQATKNSPADSGFGGSTVSAAAGGFNF